MSRFGPQTNLAGGGVDGVFALLSLVKDPEKYNAKMQEILEAEARLNEKIALAGVAEQIVAIRAETERFLLEADQTLKQAQMQATHIVDEAQKRAFGIIQEAKEELERAAVQAAKTQEDARQAASALIEKTKKDLAEKTKKKDLLEAEATKQCKLAAEKLAQANDFASSLDGREEVLNRHAQYLEEEQRAHEAECLRFKQFCDEFAAFGKSMDAQLDALLARL